MTFFLDANVLIYSRADSPRREACVTVLREIAHGRVEGRTSTAVMEEVWHLERSGRAGELGGLTERSYAILAPLLPVTDEVFSLAMSLDARILSANDRVHAATCLVNGIGVIVSADAAFDELRAKNVRRIDPLDERALRALIGTDG